MGDAEREGVIHDGETVGNFEECIDGRKEGITVGAEVKHDGETVGILEEYFDGFKEGVKEGRLLSLMVGLCDGRIEVEITVG